MYGFTGHANPPMTTKLPPDGAKKKGGRSPIPANPTGRGVGESGSCGSESAHDRDLSKPNMTQQNLPGGTSRRAAAFEQTGGAFCSTTGWRETFRFLFIENVKLNPSVRKNSSTKRQELNLISGLPKILKNTSCFNPSTPTRRF